MTAEEKELRADNEVQLGNYQEFDTMQELIANLRSVSFLNCPHWGMIFYPESASSIHCFQNT